MGEVDAFISHSWRDDGTLKWQRMLEYKAAFADSHGGTEPRCWLDKVCHAQIILVLTYTTCLYGVLSQVGS